MKFTEGYWLTSQRAKIGYASCVHYVDSIPGGLRLVCPFRRIDNRGSVLDTGTITLDFVAVSDNTIKVSARHYEGYASNEARFAISEDIKRDVKVGISDEEAVLRNGDIEVRIDRVNFSYQFVVNNNVITSCGFKNLGYAQVDGTTSSVSCGENYLIEDGKPYMINDLSLAPGEYVYGLGERFTSFVKNGQSVDIWNEDGGTASQVSYKNIPFYMTNRGYGIFVDSTDAVSFEVASEKVEYVSFSVSGEELRYYFMYGPKPEKIIDEYTKLTGRPALPPAWSFGLWLSTSFTTDYDEKTVTQFVDGMFDRDIPFRVLHFDCYWMKEFHWCDFEWDERVFPDVVGMLRRYHEKGLKICVWINPYIGQGTEFFREACEKGYLLMRADGKGVRQIDRWVPGMGIVDFTNPAAVKWYTDKLSTLLAVGVDCFKTDFGERIPMDVRYYDGSDPKSMHNYYTFLYNKAVFNLLKRKKGESEAVLFARSATAGCQQFPVHWGGDCFASYASMAETLRGGLSFAMSGFAFWSHDISGFENTATADLYKRWVAFGLLSTHSRLHGSNSYRVPWMFDDESCDVVKYYSNLKCSLMPYIYSMAVKAHLTGIPVMRPMVFAYPSDPAAATLDMQYMLGDSILVAPVFNEKGLVTYYLPEGKWTHIISGEKREGGRFYQEKYDYFSLGLFAAPNTLLAVGNVNDRPDYDYRKNLTIHVYELEDGKTASCDIVDDKGNVISTVTALRQGDRVTVSTSVPLENMKVELHIEGLKVWE